MKDVDSQISRMALASRQNILSGRSVISTVERAMSACAVISVCTLLWLSPRQVWALEPPDSDVILQMFESPWPNCQYRVIDIWSAGYKGIWTPPPGRADTGDTSVGYDVYDRFDLGSDGHKTLYGTFDDVQQFNRAVHRAGMMSYADLILNHNGYSDNSLNGFLEAGDYPGFVISAPGYPWGDFHNPGDTGEQNMRVAGLIDIAQEANLRYIRQPVNADDPRNIPAGTRALFGRLADVPDPGNARFYPDLQGESFSFDNPFTGHQITKHRFNARAPLRGDAVMENATGLLLRYVQWMNEVAGYDGFRIDAMKHIPQWFFDDFYDDAAYLNGRVMLNGEHLNPFSFGEVFDGDWGKMSGYVRKNAVADRDVLDFSLYFAMQAGLTENGLANDWRNIINANFDLEDDGSINGSQGVRFIQSHDSGGPALDNVALAYTLLLPGRSVVYFNAGQFGENRSFPLGGRGDALGGIYGDHVRVLVQIANAYGRGDYYPRFYNKELLVFERQGDLLAGLNNRLDSGTDTLYVQTGFEPGTVLVELTGNAADQAVDPDGVVPDAMQVDQDGAVSLTIPRNRSDRGEHRLGYVVYGPATPAGVLAVSNVDHTLEPDEFQHYDDYENGNHRLTPIDVIYANDFQLDLETQQVVVPGFGRDRDAEGDSAIFRVNGGIDVTGQGFISTDPRDEALYGFQEFKDKASDLFSGGDGEFKQTINTAALPEGINYITVRAFRHREPGEGGRLFTDFHAAVYIYRHLPRFKTNYGDFP